MTFQRRTATMKARRRRRAFFAREPLPPAPAEI
jgi:hypothetical protein